MDWKKHILTLLNTGMTRDQIAAAMGVTTNAVREILAGRTKSPRADAAIRLLSIRPDIFGPLPSPHRPPAFAFIPAHDSQALEATA